MQKVGDSSGAKYNPGPEQSTTSAPKPPISSKPVFTPLRTGGIGAGSTGVAPLPVRVKSSDDDGWGPDAPPITRTNLEKVQPAYQPTRVNIQELKSGKQTDLTVNSSGINPEEEDVVKGGYQPIGKVDIAAIRRQAHEAGNLKDDRPEPVKGAYEPVGKVDIAAIRAKAQKADETVTKPKESPVPFERPPISTTESDINQSSRLTSLPKPKVSNRFGGGPAFTGTKPPLPTTGNATSVAPAAPVGSANRAFADQGGKTPAQLWAERKAKERGQDSGAATTPSNGPVSAVATQNSGGDWKSSYSGKTWAPVQTTHTGKSVESTPHDATGGATVESSTSESIAPRQGVNAIRDQLTQGASKQISNSADPVRSVSPSVHSPEFEAPRAPQAPGISAPQSQPLQSPALDYSEGEDSPIQVAMPVARSARDDTEEHYPPSVAEHTKDLEREPSGDQDQPRGVQDASIVVPASDAGSGPIRALVHYDYEKAEDNEVDLKEGEYVNEIEMVDKDWWLGLNARGEKGLFPSNYVEIIEDEHQDRAPSETQPGSNAFSPETVTGSTVSPDSRAKPTAKALYDYEAAEDNELSFPEDAEITNIVSPSLFLPLHLFCPNFLNRPIC